LPAGSEITPDGKAPSTSPEEAWRRVLCQCVPVHTDNLPTGLSSLTAVYSGDAEFAASTSIVISEDVVAFAQSTSNYIN
jgi:hypothetical protein